MTFGPLKFGKCGKIKLKIIIRKKTDFLNISFVVISGKLWVLEFLNYLKYWPRYKTKLKVRASDFRPFLLEISKRERAKKWGSVIKDFENAKFWKNPRKSIFYMLNKVIWSGFIYMFEWMKFMDAPKKPYPILKTPWGKGKNFDGSRWRKCKMGGRTCNVRWKRFFEC